MWPDMGAVRDGIIFNLLNIIGGVLWTLDRILLMLAAVLHWFRVLLVGGAGQDNLLGLLMTQLLQGNELLKQLVFLGLMLAFTALAFTLIARPLIGRVQAVEMNRVVLWFFVSVLVFSAGPGMVAGLESTRLGLQEQAHLIASSIQYGNQVNRYNNSVVPGTVGDFWLPGQAPGFVPHLFGNNVGTDCPSGCNGLDAAAAFLGAEEGDITGARAEASNTGGYPAALYARFFTWREGTEQERAASIRNALDGVMRLMQGSLPAFFAVLEAAVFLLFGMSALILFVSLPAALPFAFFSLTEVIAASVLRAYLFLVLRTFVVATMLAFLVQMLIIFAERGTALVFIAVSMLTMMLSFQFVHMAAGSVTAALNVIGSAIGSATGASAKSADPFKMAGRAVGLAGAAGLAAATGGGALLGAAGLLTRQGGLRGGGVGAVGSAALEAARRRAGGAVGRTPLRGFGKGYEAVHTYHAQSRARRRQEADARALMLDRDAEEAAAVLLGSGRASRSRKAWVSARIGEWKNAEAERQQYIERIRRAGMPRLAGRVRSLPGHPRSRPAARSVSAETPGTPGTANPPGTPTPGTPETAAAAKAAGSSGGERMEGTTAAVSMREQQPGGGPTAAVEAEDSIRSQPAPGLGSDMGDASWHGTRLGSVESPSTRERPRISPDTGTLSSALNPVPDAAGDGKDGSAGTAAPGLRRNPPSTGHFDNTGPEPKAGSPNAGEALPESVLPQRANSGAPAARTGREVSGAEKPGKRKKQAVRRAESAESVGSVRPDGSLYSNPSTRDTHADDLISVSEPGRPGTGRSLNPNGGDYEANHKETDQPDPSPGRSPTGERSADD